MVTVPKTAPRRKQREPFGRIRNGAVDLYAGAEAFQGLLQAVREQQPDLVVIDTLNRSVGSAEQNSASDMSVVTARIAEIKAAAGDDCTVIVIAHTDKGDKDARGSSAIEDDADFVLHCKKADDRLAVTVAKMKDGESGQTIDLAVKPVGESLVLTPVKPGSPAAVESYAWAILRYLADMDALSATRSQIQRGTGIPLATVKRHLSRLHDTGQIVNVGSETKPKWRLPPQTG